MAKPLKVKVEFTLNIDPEYLDALMELSVSEDAEGIRNFIRMDALDYIRGYLEDNGVVATVTGERF